MAGVQFRRGIEGLREQRRQAEVDDLKTQLLFESLTRPVEGGSVREQAPPITVPGARMAVPGGSAGMQFPDTQLPGFSAMRKADPSRLRTYRTRRGQTLTGELLTQDELHDSDLGRRIREATLLSNAEALSKADAMRREREEFGMDVPGYGRFLPQQAAPLYGHIINQGAQDKRAEAQRTWEEKQKALDRQTQETIKRIADIAAGARTKKTAEARIEAARITAGKPNASQAGVQARFDERQFEAAMTKHDKLQEQEQDLHNLRRAYGEALEAKERTGISGIFRNGETFIDPDDGKEKTMNALWRKSLERRIDRVTKEIEGLAEQQKKIRKKYGTGEFAEGTAQAPRQGGSSTSKALADPLGIR